MITPAHIAKQIALSNRSEKVISLPKLFYKLRSRVRSHVLEMYFTFVYPQLLYGVVTLTMRSSMLNNKLLRIAQNSPVQRCTVELYKRYSTLPIRLLHKYNLLYFIHVHKCFYNRRRRRRKCDDLKCVRKPTKSRLSLTHHANKSSC